MEKELEAEWENRKKTKDWKRGKGDGRGGEGRRKR